MTPDTLGRMANVPKIDSTDSIRQSWIELEMWDYIAIIYAIQWLGRSYP